MAEAGRPPLKPIPGVTRYVYCRKRKDSNGERLDVGYYARIMRHRKQHSAYFADGAHGGWRGALAKALAWRKRMEKALPNPWVCGRKPAKGRRRVSR